MRIQTKAQYLELAKALHAEGLTAETVYEPVMDAGCIVELENGTVYEGIYISRVIAVMHELEANPASGERKPLRLGKK